MRVRRSVHQCVRKIIFANGEGIASLQTMAAKILPSRFACRLAFAPTYTHTPALDRWAGRGVRVGGEVTDAQNTITRVSTTRPPNSRRSEDLLGSADRAHPVGWLVVILLFPFVLLFISLFLSLSFAFSTSLGRPRESDSLHVPRSLLFARACELRKTEAVQLSSVLLRWGALWPPGSLFLGAHSPSGRRWGARIFRTIRVPHRRHVLSMLKTGN